MARLSLALLDPVQVCLDGAPLNTFESDKGPAGWRTSRSSRR